LLTTPRPCKLHTAPRKACHQPRPVETILCAARMASVQPISKAIRSLTTMLARTLRTRSSRSIWHRRIRSCWHALRIRRRTVIRMLRSYRRSRGQLLSLCAPSRTRHHQRGHENSTNPLYISQGQHLP
jgi:hypothetical protein